MCLCVFLFFINCSFPNEDVIHSFFFLCIYKAVKMTFTKHSLVKKKISVVQKHMNLEDTADENVG